MLMWTRAAIFRSLITTCYTLPFAERARSAIKESFTLQHGSICVVGDGKHMRRNFVAFDSLISLHNLFGVDRKLLVRIDDDAEKT